MKNTLTFNSDAEVIAAKRALDSRMDNIVQQSNGMLDWGFIVEMYEPSKIINAELKERGLA